MFGGCGGLIPNPRKNYSRVGPPLAVRLLLTLRKAKTGGSVLRAQSNSIVTMTVFVLLALCTAAAQEPSPAAQNPTLDEIVAGIVRTQAFNREKFRPYTVTREYKLFGDDPSKVDSEVMAEISFVPPTKKDYSITKTNGSGQGERVVRRVLDHEQEMTAQWERTALTVENYNFELLGEEVNNGHRCFVLKMIPKRDSKDLIVGRALIDAETFNVVSMEGELAKTPSWWVKKVQLTLHFGEVKGMWLQTSAKADADIRVFGKHVLVSRDVNCRADAIVARKLPTAKKNPVKLISAGVLVR